VCGDGIDVDGKYNHILTASWRVNDVLQVDTEKTFCVCIVCACVLKGKIYSLHHFFIAHDLSS